jgi:hypothetical protein
VASEDSPLITGRRKNGAGACGGGKTGGEFRSKKVNSSPDFVAPPPDISSPAPGR